jgi:hypothetical protein
MGRHRDNYTRESLRRMREGEPPFYMRTVSGIENSQREGTCVIVYSMDNCPMLMCFKCLKPRLGPTQLSDMYEVQPTFTMECGPGSISILDNIDDTMMMHIMIFIGMKLRDDLNTLVRAACVIRRGENMQF